MTARTRLRIGTRGSRLALWQSEHVASHLREAFALLDVETVVIHTLGDQVLDQALSKIGDKGLFTRELEEALARGRIDLAVHSLKDLPTEDSPGFSLGAVTRREDPRDAVVSASGLPFLALPEGARLGTSSLRRRAQALLRRPDVRPVDLRGNVPTRLEKLERGDCDALILARVGLVRLGLGDRVTEVLDAEEWLPAVGQGALALQIRSDDVHTRALVAALDDAPTRLATAAERAFLGGLQGGCQVPIGALGRFTGDHLVLLGMVADVDGLEVVRGREEAQVRTEQDASALGRALAARLRNEGAGEILARLREQTATREIASMWVEP